MTTSSGKDGRRPERDASGRWLPGKPGGPGRPKGSGGAPSLMAAIRRQLRDNPDTLEELAANFIQLALDGDHRALHSLKALLERLDGPVIQKIELDTEGAIEFRVRFPKPAGASKELHDDPERPEQMDDQQTPED